MWKHVITSFLVLVVYLFFKLYYWPKKTQNYYVKTLTDLGYKVYAFPFAPLGSSSLKATKDDNKKYKDSLYFRKNIACNYDITISNILHKNMISISNPDLLK